MTNFYRLLFVFSSLVIVYFNLGLGLLFSFGEKIPYDDGTSPVIRQILSVEYILCTDDNSGSRSKAKYHSHDRPVYGQKQLHSNFELCFSSRCLFAFKALQVSFPDLKPDIFTSSDISFPFSYFW